MTDSGPAATTIYRRLDEFFPTPDSVYVYATTEEERSAHSPAWEARSPSVNFTRLVDDSRTNATFECRDGAQLDVSLRSAASLREFWSACGAGTVYLDITGFGHHVWAPLLRAAAELNARVLVVYVEPVEYAQSPIPTEGEIFDLSERIEGISPIPGFASLSDAGTAHLVPLLGFEGTRFAHVLEAVQPDGDEVTPIIGVPGFRPEYPFHTYLGNKTSLMSSRSWVNVRYVTANCPFSLVRELRGLLRDKGGLKIAPIGTKPHSLGAVLLAIAEPRSVELVYDHPIRTAKRTSGSARTLVYDVTSTLGAGRHLLS